LQWRGPLAYIQPPRSLIAGVRPHGQFRRVVYDGNRYNHYPPLHRACYRFTCHLTSSRWWSRYVEDQASKLIRVPAWRGAMAYWGLASLGRDWNTKHWLETQAKSAGGHTSPEDYALALADNLTRELGRRGLRRPIDSGLGIHFSAYEYVEGYWIPELFLVSNWTDTSYSAVRPDGFLVTRETFATLQNLSDRPPEQRQLANRRAVHTALHQSQLMFRFNNGDPALFNPIGDSVLSTFSTLYARGHVHDSTSVQTHLSLVRRPVDVVSKLLADLAEPASRVIGGRPHDLAISPSGQYESTSGD